MKAKDMFKELGYVYYTETQDEIIYENDIKTEKIVFKINNFQWLNCYCNNGIYLEIGHIKAIQKQIEELGWK